MIVTTTKQITNVTVALNVLEANELRQAIHVINQKYGLDQHMLTLLNLGRHIA